MTGFRDRREAGVALAARLGYLRAAGPVVVALPRGGVPVALEVSRALGAPLDVIVVRKLGVPSRPELGMGAIGEDGARVLNDDVVRMMGVTADQLAAVEVRERSEVERRAARYRVGRPMIPLEGRTVIVVDDGIATGGTMRAAVQIARAHGARAVVVAAPVAPREVIGELASVADEVVVLETPAPFSAIGLWYEDFRQLSDDDVTGLLGRAGRIGPQTPAVDEGVLVGSHPLRLPGRLTIPEHARGLVVFAHGSGSSSRSPRNRMVAGRLNEQRLGTLVFDLLTDEEAVARANVFDVELLAVRLLAATRWLRERSGGDLPIGYFGASTGAAAALWAAAEAPEVGAVVSRGGRPDLAGDRLEFVRAPTLLLVGGEDRAVIGLNEHAGRRLRCEHRLVIVPGATHLFEEPGALETVAQLAGDWFSVHLASVPTGGC